MSQFNTDLTYSEKQRTKLKSFYSTKAFEGRYVFINKASSPVSQKLQNMAIDTIFQISDSKEIYIEEKIVRWPGYKYTAFVFETDSCTVIGREKSGWMKYGEFDFLLYGFEQASGDIEAYSIPFPKLKEWFWNNYTTYPATQTIQINHTFCRIVPIKDVESHVGFTKYFIGAL